MADDLLEEQQADTETGAAGQADPDDSAGSGDPLEGDEELQKALLSLYLECSSEDRYPRLIEVKDVKQAENYWAGRQYWYWSDRDETWKPAPGVGVSPLGDLDFDEMPRFEFVTNIYQSKGLIQIGAVAGAPPRIRFFPEDADDPNDLDTADGRTKLTKLIERWNPPQLSLQREMYHFYTGGFCAWWVHYLENGDKWGYDTADVTGSEELPMDATIHCPNCGWSAPAAEAAPPVPCPQCGAVLTQEDVSEEEPISVPTDQGTEDVPRGREIIEPIGVLNFKRPQHTDEQGEWHYCAYEREVHYSILRRHAPTKEIADSIKPGMNFGPDDAFERNARLSVAENAKMPTQTGAKQSSLVTRAIVWFRPDAFWMMKDEELRERALELFPRGCQVTFAGNTFYESKAISMDDCIVSKHALPGRGQHRNGVGTSMISVQDRYNTFSNIAAETYEYGIPITYRDAETFSGEADEEQRAAPGLEVEVALRPGDDIRAKILQVRADSVSPDMHEHMNELAGPMAEEMSGSYQAVAGAGEQGPETLGQESMRRDQAMGRLGVFYVNLKQARAEIMTLACKDYEQQKAGQKTSMAVLGDSGDFENESVDISAMEGDATAYPEGDENFPELWNQQRATVMQMMDTPYGMQLAQDMGNAQLFARLMGVPDMKVPNVDDWQMQLREINELTRIPEGDELLTGIAPEVEVAPYQKHPVHIACCEWWLNSERGQKVKRENPLGFQAVVQHWQQHVQQIPKPQPPEKPISETFSAAFKDLPPAAKIQVLSQMGIQITEQDLLKQALLDKASKPAPKPFVPPNGAGETRPNA